MADELAEQVAGVGALVEPGRRALYLYVAAQPHAVSREQAANALHLPLHSVRFHLDRLVAEGLLEVEFRRLSGRTGPGAGRPAKLYRRSSRQLSVSLPERRYDLVGAVLATAIERSARDAMPIMDAVLEAAREEGQRIAAEYADDRSASRAGTEPLGKIERTAHVLAGHGYEPRPSVREICLANCPFDRLATEHTGLVCGMNLALVRGLIDGLDIGDLSAELAPEPGFCCVRVRG